MLQRPSQNQAKRSSGVVSSGSSANTAVGREIEDFIKTTDLYYEANVAPDGQKILSPKLGVNKAGSKNEQQIMEQYGWYWEPLLHDLSFLAQMRDNIPLVSGVYEKFSSLVMEGFRLECEDPDDNEEINELLIDDATVDFSEVVRSAVHQIATIANCYFRPVYATGDRGFHVRTFRPIIATAMRKLRDENLIVQGYVQLLHRPSEFLFGTPTTPTVWLAEEMCCGSAYTDGWYAYGKPPLAALPFVAKMKLQMERDLVEMLHQHVPRIDITYTPDAQMNEDQVQAAMKDATSQVAGLKSTDNYIHTPDFTFEYKGPGTSGLDFSNPMRYISEQLYAVLPLLSGYLSSDLNVNPMIATQSFRITCAIANYVRSRVNVMFRPVFDKLADERGLSKISIAFTDLDAETAETTARTQEYQANNAATNRDNGFVDQDTAAKHATAKAPGGPVKKAAEPGAIPPPAPPVDPNKQPPGGTKPSVGDAKKPPSKGGRSRTQDTKKGPKGKNRSAPTPDKRTKGRRHETVLSLEDEVQQLRDYVAEIF
jgi:hypothetical protein